LFVWDEQPICRKCTGATSFSGSPSPTTSPEADGLGEYNPQRVQQVHWASPVTSRLLLEAGIGTSYYQWGNRERDPNPTENLARVFNIGQVVVPATGTTPAITANLTYRSQNWMIAKTAGVNMTGSATYVTGSHSMKFGYQGYWWRDDRELHVNTQDVQYTFIAGGPSSITEYVNPYTVNARAMQTSLFAQDQWTFKRLTLQGALRWDHPWSWFPEQVEPKNRFFPGTTFPRTDGVTGYNDVTTRVGAAYDLLGTGKTALKVSVGKYLQGASVSNLAYNANPALRIPFGPGLSGGGIFNPGVSRSWMDNNHNFIPDCDLTNPLAQSPATTGSIDTCGAINNLQFGSNQLVGAQFDPDLLHGRGCVPQTGRSVCRCSNRSFRAHRWRSATTAVRSRCSRRVEPSPTTFWSRPVTWARSI
jgi:hypothetical protein